MTLDQALQRAGQLIDEACAQALIDCEDQLRCRGASEEETGIELARMKAEGEAERRRVLELIRATWETPSSWIH